MALDPGGIGKGLAGDLVVAELLRLGAGGALVSVGGDITAGGAALGDDGWAVDVVHAPDIDAPLARLMVNAGGIATSSTRTRRWVRDGVGRHHAIDPATGTTSNTDLAAVTVVATSGWRAEAHATAALLCGSSAVIAYLDAAGVSGIASTLDGELLTTDDLVQAVSTPTGSAVLS
jgi:thiamine biosynthesis lipoprotein